MIESVYPAASVGAPIVRRAPRPWSNREIRKLLRNASRPHKLALDPLARQLAQLLGIDPPIAALRKIVDEAFSGHGEPGRRLRDLIVACDLDGTATQASVAEAMHLSTRQFFRLRADAVAVVANRIRSVLAASVEAERPLAALAELIGECEPASAVRIYDILEASGEQPALLARMRARVSVGETIDPTVLAGDVKTSILTTVLAARSREAQGERAAAVALLASAESRVAIPSLAEASDVRFEIEAVHCLRARHESRPLDLAERAVRLRAQAGDDPTLVVRATIVQIEAALATRDIERARGLLEFVQRASYAARDGRSLGSAVLMQSHLAFLEADYRRAEDYATAAGFALRHQPADATIASIAVGRARLALGKRWSLEERLAARPLASWERVLAEIVGARHLLLSGRTADAVTRAARAQTIALEQSYHGLWAQATATLGTCAGLAERLDEEQRCYREALRRFAIAGDAMEGHDLFAVPGACARDLGPIELDDAFLDTIVEISDASGLRAFLRDLIVYAADLEADGESLPRSHAAHQNDPALGPMLAARADNFRIALRTLLAIPLHAERRDVFAQRFDVFWQRYAW